MLKGLWLSLDHLLTEYLEGSQLRNEGLRTLLEGSDLGFESGNLLGCWQVIGYKVVLLNWLKICKQLLFALKVAGVNFTVDFV